MPYRALLWMVLTVGLALLAVALWVNAVSSMMQPEKPAASHPVATAIASTLRADDPNKSFTSFVSGVLLLSFLLICLLFVVGVAATFREWMRSRHSATWFVRRRRETSFVDAWKIAGDRLKLDEKPPEPPADL